MPHIIKNNTNSYIMKNGIAYGDGLNGYVIKNGIYYNYDVVFRPNYPKIGTLIDTHIRDLPYYENEDMGVWSLTDSLDNYNLFQFVLYQNTNNYYSFQNQVIVSKERLMNSDYWHPIIITRSDVDVYIYNYPDESDKLCAARGIDSSPVGGDTLVLRGIE